MDLWRFVQPLRYLAGGWPIPCHLCVQLEYQEPQDVVVPRPDFNVRKPVIMSNDVQTKRTAAIDVNVRYRSETVHDDIIRADMTPDQIRVLGPKIQNRTQDLALHSKFGPEKIFDIQQKWFHLRRDLSFFIFDSAIRRYGPAEFAKRVEECVATRNSARVSKDIEAFDPKCDFLIPYD